MSFAQWRPVALGLPCVSVSKADAYRLMDLIEGAPETVVDVDIESNRLTAGDVSLPISLPAGARDGFLDGSWDATGLLLDKYEEVEAVAASLPYVSTW